jgi:hypothetical protein
MAQVNPDPHAQGYVFIPTNRVTGFLLPTTTSKGHCGPWNR